MTTIDSSLPVDAGSLIDKILTGSMTLSNGTVAYLELLVLIGEDGNILTGE
jgi:hypothetical protein